MFKRFLKALGFVHDQEQALALPSEQKKRKAATQEQPKDIVTTKTGVFKVENTIDSVQWSRVQNSKDAAKVNTLSSVDIEQLAARGIEKDLVRAAEMKRIWATGATANECSKAANIGLRTAQKYWASFNKSK